MKGAIGLYKTSVHPMLYNFLAGDHSSIIGFRLLHSQIIQAPGILNYFQTSVGRHFPIPQAKPVDPFFKLYLFGNSLYRDLILSLYAKYLPTPMGLNLTALEVWVKFKLK